MRTLKQSQQTRKKGVLASSIRPRLKIFDHLEMIFMLTANYVGLVKSPLARFRSWFDILRYLRTGVTMNGKPVTPLKNGVQESRRSIKILDSGWSLSRTRSGAGMTK